MDVMRWPLALLTVLLSGLLLLPFAFPVAADGDDGKDGKDERDGEGSDGHDDEEDEQKDEEKEDDDEDEARRGEGRHEQDRGDDARGEDDRDDKDGRDEDGGKDKDDDDKDDERRGHGKDKDKEKDRDADDPADPADPARDADPLATPRSARADVRVSQDYDVAPGLLTFTFTVTNHGDQAAQDVQLSGALPDIGTWVIVDATRCDLGGDGVECALGDLHGGEVVEVEARSVLVGELPAFTNVVQVYTPPRAADAPSSP